MNIALNMRGCPHIVPFVLQMVKTKGICFIVRFFIYKFRSFCFGNQIPPPPPPAHTQTLTFMLKGEIKIQFSQ